ncbi:MAG TPA: type II secretion system F family protein [Paraburkholderia sp.]|jgi:tight adherence protein C|nr:type II secretion system F family protein [Paraburkholderia sp.]
MNNTAADMANLVLLLLVVIGVVYYYRFRRGTNERIADRMRSLHALNLPPSEEDDATHASRGRRWALRLAAFGERLPLLDAKQRKAITLTLVRAGFRSRRATSLMVTLKFFAGVLIGFFVLQQAHHLPTLGRYTVFRVIIMIGAFVIGMIVPEYALALYASKRRKKIAATLPDALDLLVICTNAGNSLNVGIRRVAAEVSLMSPALAEELKVTADEMQLGGDSATALRNFAHRVNLPAARSLVSTLIQSQQFGTPITQALRVLSRMERQASIMALEEKAAKLAPKMTLPMMLFILPVVVIIAAGPAVLRLIDFFRHAQ